MKILRVTQAIYPYVVGGSPTHCHELSMYQSSNKHKISVLTIKNKKNSKVDDVPVNYDVIQCKHYPMPWDFINIKNPISPYLCWHILKSDYDLLHAHSHLFFPTFFSLIMNKIKNKPSVLTVHGVKAIRNKKINFLEEVWLHTFSRYIFQITDKIICLTNSDAKQIQKYGAKENKIEIIPNAIDTNLFNPTDQHNHYLFWAGRFVEEKGLNYLIDAMEDIVKIFPDIKIILAGEGPLKGEIVKKVKTKDMERFVEFKNNCSQKEISKLMKECELYILPSLQEGFPKSLLEAMACGKPVITTNGLTEIVRDAGVTINPGSTEELVHAITQYLSDPSAEKKSGERGRSYVEQNCSWDIVGQKINDVYLSFKKGY